MDVRRNDGCPSTLLILKEVSWVFSLFPFPILDCTLDTDPTLTLQIKEAPLAWVELSGKKLGILDDLAKQSF
jgi:hypothetical protein